MRCDQCNNNGYIYLNWFKLVMPTFLECHMYDMLPMVETIIKNPMWPIKKTIILSFEYLQLSSQCVIANTLQSLYSPCHFYNHQSRIATSNYNMFAKLSSMNSFLKCTTFIHESLQSILGYTYFHPFGNSYFIHMECENAL